MRPPGAMTSVTPWAASEPGMSQHLPVPGAGCPCREVRPDRPNPSPCQDMEPTSPSGQVTEQTGELHRRPHPWRASCRDLVTLCGDNCLGTHCRVPELSTHFPARSQRSLVLRDACKQGLSHPVLSRAFRTLESYRIS